MSKLKKRLLIYAFIAVAVFIVAMSMMLATIMSGGYKPAWLWKLAFVGSIVIEAIAGACASTLFAIFAYLNCKKEKDPNLIFVKAKPGKVTIDCQNKKLVYKKSNIKFADIVSYELVDNTHTVLKSGLGEAVLGGVLFGGTGAIAGAYAGKREKIKERCKIYIKTKNVQNAGVVINLTLDNGYQLYETIDLMMDRMEGRDDLETSI